MWKTLHNVGVYCGLLNEDGTKNKYRCNLLGASAGLALGGIALYAFRKPITKLLCKDGNED